MPTDITDPEACARLMAAGVEEFGGIDVLVNNAFRFDAFQSFEDVDLASWRKIMDTNLFGSLQMTRAALPAMRARGGGSVVMVASMVTRQPQPAQGGYAISKGALLTATRVLAYELGPSKVRVNAVVPGWMAGPSVDIYVEMTSTGRGVPAQVVVDELNARVPLGPDPERRGRRRIDRLPRLGPLVGHDRPGARHQRRRDLRLSRAARRGPVRGSGALAPAGRARAGVPGLQRFDGRRRCLERAGVPRVAAVARRWSSWCSARSHPTGPWWWSPAGR